MDNCIITNEQLKVFVGHLTAKGNVVGVKKKENKFAFGPLSDPDDLVLDYDVTLTPPKQYLFPQWEELLRFETKPTVKVEAVMDASPITVIGVHPYDLKAINQIDRFYEDQQPDNHYMKRRENMTIIAVTPKRASKWSFWSSMDSAYVTTGYDLMLTDIGGKYLVEVGTSRGEELLKKYAKTEKTTPEDLQKREKIRLSLATICESKRKLFPPLSEVPALIESSYESKVWEKQAEKCYSCGSCVLICPTCVCFDVQEELNLNLKGGKRWRVWDGCLLENFAKIGSGENFREERKDRFRHRFFRKGVYLHQRFGEVYCVGCGRCSEACLPDIADPVQVIGKLKENL